ncbi:MAG: MraY family glycosyltransferase [Candidatus Omnitrophica bacterium]|nr:MraY family glycosyltransferase [Candidatus Omnitrophota bacterium]
MKPLILLLISFLSALILTPIAKLIARRFKILDLPNKRKIHKAPVPLLGGAVIWLSFLIAILYAGPRQSEIKGLVLGGSLVFLVGLIDDIKGLSALFRLIIQIIASAIIIKSGVCLSFLPPTLWGDMAEVSLTVFWVVGITNALNFLDGLDGLATGVSAIALACFLIIGILTGQPVIIALTLAALGSCLGFLTYNLRPANIFLGDAGSNFLGFILAGFAILGDWAYNNTVALVVPVLILGVPIFDVIFTTVMRIKNGEVKNLKEWLEYTGKDHFHHRLLDMGFNPLTATVFIYFVSLAFGISAIVLLKAPLIHAILLLVQISIIFTLIAALMVVGKKATR